MKSHDACSKVDICSTPKKASFKMALSTFDVDSFFGRQFNATFYVDFNQIIHDPELFKKQYKMSYTFSSGLDSTAINTILPTTVYGVHIDMNKSQYIGMANNKKVISGVVPVDTFMNGATLSARFNASASDNAPVFVNDLRDITQITVNLYDMNTNTTFNNANDPTINNATKYVCVLTFDEI